MLMYDVDILFSLRQLRLVLRVNMNVKSGHRVLMVQGELLIIMGEVALNILRPVALP